MRGLLAHWTAGALAVVCSCSLLPEALAAERDNTEKLYRQINKLARECDARKAKACVALADIAKNASDQSVGQGALGKLTDQTLLVDVAKNARDQSIGQAALGRLTQQTLLADIAKNANNKAVRWDAAHRFIDIEGPANGCDYSRERLRRLIAMGPLDLAVTLFLPGDLDQFATAGMLRKSADEFARDALASIGLDVGHADRESRGSVRIAVTVDSLVARYRLEGSSSGMPGSNLHTGAKSFARLSVHGDEGCVYSKDNSSSVEPPPRMPFINGRYSQAHHASDAPLHEALWQALGEAVVQFTADNIGSAVVEELAKTNTYYSVRKAAVGTLTDLDVLALVAKADNHRDVREAANLRLTYLKSRER